MADDAILNEKTATRLDWRLWRSILRFANPYRWHLLGVVVMGMSIASLDVYMPLLFRDVIDIAAGVRETDEPLWPYAVTFGCIALVFTSLVCGFILLVGRTATGMSHDIRRAGFAKLQTLDFAFYDQHNVGWLMARLTSDTNRVSRIIGWVILDAAWGSVCFSAAVVMMFVLDWRTALAVLVVLPVLLLVNALFHHRILTASRQVRRINSQITANFNEAIAGMKTTKSLVREDENYAEFRVESDAMYIASMRSALLSAMYLPLVIGVVSVSEGLAVAVGGGRALAGMMTIGTLVGFMHYARHLPEPIREISARITDLLGAQAAAERVVSLLETEPTIVDSAQVRQAVAQREAMIASRAVEGGAQVGAAADGLATDGGRRMIDHVRFEEVGFEYRPGQPVLSGFSLDVHRGQTIALVGPTGGGKSTIINLLCRFYEPTAGRILFDGVEYRQRSLEWLHSNLGIVLQAPHLFTGTVADNIRYGRLDATDEQVIEAARMVHAHPFIEQLDGGYEAQVGQAGANLSSGQRQLISFARAVLSDPQIFVMDEATSAVDTETEQLIQRGMHRVLSGRISFIIAHRLSTIRSADRILVIADGRIAESGTHRELLARRGRYFDLYTNQFTREHADALFAEPADDSADDSPG